MTKLTLPLLLCVGLTGCATYQPVPLTPEAVDAALAPPDMAAVKMAAERIHHPLIRPLSLDISDGLSPDEVAIMAVLVNPSLRTVRDQRALAGAQLLEAGLLPNPQLSGSVEPVIGGVTEGTSTGYGIGLGWDLNALITRRGRRAGAKAASEEVDLDVAWQEWQVAEGAKLAAYTMLTLQRQVILARNINERLNENLKTVRKAVDAGLMTEMDLAGAQTASHQAHADLAALQTQLNRQSLVLKLAMGLPSDAQISMQEGIPLPANIEMPSERDLLSGLDQRRLDLMALRKGYDSQEAAVRTSILGQFPSIAIGLTRARDTGNLITLPFDVSIDIPIFDRNRSAIAGARATRQQLYDEYINRIFEARSNISSLIANIHGIEEQLRVAEAALPDFQRLVETYRRAVNDGQADVLSYYTAWNELSGKQQEILNLKQQLMETCIGLEVATGAYDLSSLKQRNTQEITTNEVKQ